MRGVTSLVGENGSFCISAIAVQVKDDFLHWVLRLEQTPKRTTLFVSQLWPRSYTAETLEATNMFLVLTGRELRGLTNDFALADVRRMTSPIDGQKRG